MPRPASIEPGSDLAQRLEAAVEELGSRRKAAVQLGLGIGSVNRYFGRVGQAESDQPVVQRRESIQNDPMHGERPHARPGAESNHVRPESIQGRPGASCDAQTRDGDPCHNAPMANGRCRMHGGKSLTGAAAPAFKTGRWSKNLPPRLRERYDAAHDDQELLALKDEIALTDARIEDLIQRVDIGEAGALWRKAAKLMEEFHEANGRDDAADRQFRILAELEATITEGVSDYAAWDEVNKMIGQRTKLVEAERKRQVELQQMIPVEQAMVLLAQITNIVQRHVTDRAVRAAIADEFVRLTGRPVGRVLDVSGGGAGAGTGTGA